MSDYDERDVVYVEREGGSIKPLVFGLLLGVGIGLLFAPQSGEQTRRSLNRRLRKVRALAEEKVDELSERFSTGGGRPSQEADVVRPVRETVREDLERRLAQARARRRTAAEDEEQHA
jgi:gas vesicle protein